MSLYIDYPRFSESNQIDKTIYNSIISAKWSLVLLFLVTGPISSFVPLTVLFIRTLIPDIYVRRILGWIMVLWTFFNGMSPWMLLFLNIEITREFLRFGVPYLLVKASTVVPDDPISETVARRLFKALRVVTQQNAIITFQQVMLSGIGYGQGDKSEAFTPEEKQKFLKFFQEFSKTSFIYESDTNSITIFFPSFIIRFTHHGLQLTSDDALTLIRRDKDQKEEDDCPICHEKYSELSVKLKCNHRYCHKCIFNWLNQQYTCPLCRTTVN